MLGAVVQVPLQLAALLETGVQQAGSASWMASSWNQAGLQTAFSSARVLHLDGRGHQPFMSTQGRVGDDARQRPAVGGRGVEDEPVVGDVDLDRVAGAVDVPRAARAPSRGPGGRRRPAPCAARPAPRHRDRTPQARHQVGDGGLHETVLHAEAAKAKATAAALYWRRRRRVWPTASGTTGATSGSSGRAPRPPRWRWEQGPALQAAHRSPTAPKTTGRCPLPRRATRSSAAPRGRSPPAGPGSSAVHAGPSLRRVTLRSPATRPAAGWRRDRGDGDEPPRRRVRRRVPA